MKKYTLSRRQFLKQAAAFTAATAIPVDALAKPGSLLAGPQPQEVAPGVPRAECLILEDPEGTILPADDFNRWRSGERSHSTGLQQLALDALWYIDPDAGVAGVWDNALAAEKPIYNEDFTTMTVKLREGIYWSDGVEFTADDLYYTVDVQMKNPGFLWSGLFIANIDHMEQPDRNTVIFYLKEPNSRFHTGFTVRWGACFIMPKHIFEQQEDPLAYTFYPPVSLGAYTLRDHDPNGNWFLWERREDWQRTTVALLGDVDIKYAMYVAPGPSDKRVIAQLAHELDVIHDITPEGRITLAKESPSSIGWFPSFPWAHPDPTLPAVIYNHDKPGLDKKEVRWALTLAIDIVQVALASYRGAATISCIDVPPTGMYPQYYIEPLEPWLLDFTIKVGGQDYKPYDPTAAQKIADEARKSLGDLVPTDPDIIKKYIGAGWWKRDLAAAEQLMLDAGMQKKDGKWAMPDGSEFKVPMMSLGDRSPTINRAAAMIVENWTEFGIDTTLEAPLNPWDIMKAGDYTANLAWVVETWGGDPDLFYFLQYYHSKYYTPSGQAHSAGNPGGVRWKNAEVDRIIEALQALPFDATDETVALGLEYCKLAAQEMPTTPLMAYNVFTTMDTTYFTGYPSIDDPYTDPVPNWANTKYMFVKIKPKTM